MSARRDDLRQAVWDALRPKVRFTTRDLAETGASRMAIHNWLTSWEEDGWVRRVGQDGQHVVYAATTVQAEAPPARAPAGAAPAKGPLGQHLWTAARMLRIFTLVELAAHAATEGEPTRESDARSFVSLLTRAGYARKMRVTSGRPARYRLIRDTGPRPPVEKRVRATWDANLGAYVHVPEPAR
jgi:hypothetical protein